MVELINSKAASANVAQRLANMEANGKGAMSGAANTTGAAGDIASTRVGRLPKPALSNMPAPALSSAVAGLARDMAAKSPVDTAKVADVKARMDAGIYKVDAGRIADAMLSHELGVRKLR